MKQKSLQNKIKKYFSIAAFFLLGFYYSNAQTVNILYNLNTTDSTVIGSSRYHASESIYTDAEIGSGNFVTAGSAIQKIYFYLYTEGTTTTVSSYKIWMKNIPATTTTLSTGIYNTSGYTLVYNGAFTASPAGFIGITLNTPFTRTSGNNLEILIERLDRVIHPGYFFLESEGNSTDPAVLSSRKYNGTAAPVSGTTSLTQTVSRPAIVLVHTFPLDAEIYDIVAPAASNSAFVIAEPKPAAFSIITSCPALTNSETPSGVIATRDSWTFISLGTPTIIYLPFAATAAFIKPINKG